MPAVAGVLNHCPHPLVLAVDGRGDQAGRGKCGLACRPEEGSPRHRGGRWGGGEVYPAVRSNARVVNLRGRGRPIGRHDGGAPGRAGRHRGPRARVCCGIGGLDFDVDCRRPAQTGERVWAGDTCHCRPCPSTGGAGAQIVTGRGAVGAVDRRCGPSDGQLAGGTVRRWRDAGDRRGVRRAGPRCCCCGKCGGG